MKQCKYCKSEIDDKATICPNCRKKQKKHGVLRWIIGVPLLLIGVLIIIAIATGGSGEDDSALMTMEEFEAIENGMTYEEVVNIVGGEGELSNTASSGDYTIELYSWTGNGSANSNANVTFQNGVVTGKAQVGLK